MVDDEMGDREGVLMVDESGFEKKGKEYVAVDRQYSGNLGKVENCQVGVFAAYASRHGYALVAKRLFKPETGLARTMRSAGKRVRCRGAEVAHRAAVCRRDDQRHRVERRLPYKYLVADSLYGNRLD